MTLRVIVVDDHAIVRRGIVEILTERPDVQVLSEAADYSQLRAQLRQHGDIDLLVMDLSLPGKDGIEILKSLHSDNPRLRVLIVSMHPEEQYAVRAFKAGACGYLNKASAPEKLLEAVDQIAAGRKYVTPAIAQALIDQLAAPEEGLPHEKLSDREFQVLRLIAAGRRLSEIAEALSLSPKTVSVYRARILEKMNLGNNSELVHYAVKNGLA
jgi:DNA-binding NarL/FixJ family response regulator